MIIECFVGKWLLVAHFTCKLLDGYISIMICVCNFEPLFGPFMPRTIGKIKFIQKFKKFLQGGWSSTYVPSAMIIGCFNVLLVTQIFGILDHSGPFSEPFAPIARKKVNIKTQKRNICQHIAYHNFWLLDYLLGTYPWWRVMLLWGIFWPLYHSSRNQKSKFSKN